MRGLRVLYGGTFDPVHLGHLAIARAARDVLDAGISLMPAADPPHRAPPGAAAADRLAMLELAVAGEPGLRVDARELRREGRSWTVDTLHDLRGEIGADAPVALLVGADSFATLPTWKAWESLFDQAHFVVAGRAGSPGGQALPATLAAAIAGRVAASPAELEQIPAGRVFWLRQPLVPHAASTIRTLVAARDPAWRALVPAAVAGYIQAHGLYASAA